MSSLLVGIHIETWGHIVTAVFLGLFIGMVWLTYCPQRAHALSRASSLPLDEDEPVKGEHA